MPHALVGFTSVTIGAADLNAATELFSQLGFTVADGADGEAVIAFGNAHLILSSKAPPGLGKVGLLSRNLAASRAALGDGPYDVPGLSVELTGPDVPSAALHANGAVAIASLTALVDTPEAAMPAYDRLFGAFAATPTDDMVTVHGCGPMLFLVNEDGFDHLHSNLQCRLPKAPALAALAVAVTDLEAAQSLLAAADVRAARVGPSLAIPPSACLGIGLELVAR